jgi:hypothetical protein
MNDAKELLQRAQGEFPPPGRIMELLIRRRARKRRNQRIAARIVAVAVSLLVIGGLIEAFSAPPPTGDDRPTPVPSDARARLFTLGDAWFERRATVVYDTVSPVEGQPTTAHLCLRQMFDDDFGEDRTALLRRCGRQGTLRLVWDPPDGWQMDVITPVDRFTLASTHDRTQICRSGDPHACRAIPTAEAIVKAGADIFFQRPRKILAAIGATGVKTTASPTEYDGLPVECFAATGRDEHVEWCYAKDGTLVSFLRGSATAGWRSFEATAVS